VIQLAAFWKKESKNNRTYYQRKIGNGRLLLFKNDRKESEKHPDLILYIVAENSKQNGQTKPEIGQEDDVPF
jgi:hypothetical protein